MTLAENLGLVCLWFGFGFLLWILLKQKIQPDTKARKKEEVLLLLCEQWE